MLEKTDPTRHSHRIANVPIKIIRFRIVPIKNPVRAGLTVATRKLRLFTVCGFPGNLQKRALHTCEEHVL